MVLNENAIKISVPGSKSIANRALLLNALTGNQTQIHNLPDCDDVNYMQKGLQELEKPTPQLYTGNAGTTTRFLTAYSTLLEKEITIKGDERMLERPIEALTKALNQLGANTETTNGCPPVKIHPQKLQGGEITLPGDISSQYLSALLMVAPFANRPTTINIEQELCSIPYVNLTINILKQFSISVTNNNFEQFKIEPQTVTPPKEFAVEADASSASYPAAYAALHPETPVTLNINKNSIQGDIKFLQHLEQMGCAITGNNNETTIQGPKQLTALDEINMNATPDLVMTFAILATQAHGTTKITNIPNLRIKETDRLQALQTELTKIGANVKTGPDYIEIKGPTTPKPATIETYNDHRIAMCFALLPNLEILNPDCVNKSYPTFWKDLKKLQQ